MEGCIKRPENVVDRPCVRPHLLQHDEIFPKCNVLFYLNVLF